MHKPPHGIRAWTLIFALASLPLTLAHAAIGTPASLGTSSATNSGTTLTVNLSAGVAADHTVIVTFAMDPASGAVSVADSQGNSYTLDAGATNGSGTGGVRTHVFSSAITTPLTTSDVITITHPTVASRAASAFALSGLATLSAVDKTASATGNSTSPSSGSTTTTSNPIELLVGAIGTESSTATLTPGSGYSLLPTAVATNSNNGTSITLFSEFQIVSSANSYSANGSLFPAISRNWAATIVTYRDKSDQTITFASPGNQTYGSSIDLNATSSSGLTVGFGVSGPASLAGTTLTFTGTGPVTITASQAGNGAWNAAPDVERIITVNTKLLTVTGVTGNHKIYDGNTTATVGIGSASLVGVVGSDDASLAGPGTGTFNTTAVGTGKTVTISGLTLTGDDAVLYTLTQPTTTADITPKPLTFLPIIAGNKTYDFTANATVSTNGATLSGVVSGDLVTVTGTAAGFFSDRHVGTGKTVTISGLSPSSANYSLTTPTATANITPRPLTATAAMNTRAYDGSTSATAIPAITSGSLQGTDTVTLTESYSSKDAGTGNRTLIPAATITDGNSGSNYTITLVNLTTGTINPRAITITATADIKVYDGTLTSSGTPTLTSGSLAGGDSATWTQAFSTKVIGSGKTLSPSGSVTDGNSGNNYTVTFANNHSGTITTKALTVSGITASNKQADGTTTATLDTAGAALVGKADGDTVTLDTTLATGAFGDPNTGTAKPVTITGISIGGADVGNYTLTQPTTTADITPGAIDHYVVTASSALVGVPFLVIITAQDAFNQTVPNDNTTDITLGSDSENIVFDANDDGTFSNDDTNGTLNGGEFYFYAQNDVLEQNITFTVTDGDEKTGSTVINMIPGVGAYRSKQSGNWSAAGTWQVFTNPEWTDAPAPPADTDGYISIRGGHTVTVDSDLTSDEVLIEGGGQVIIPNGVTWTLANTGDSGLNVYGLLNVQGTLAFDSDSFSTVNESGLVENSGAITTAGATLIFHGGIYRHAFTTTSGTIPDATWEAGASCEVVGYTSNTSSPNGLGQTFDSFIWNCPNQSQAIPLSTGPVGVTNLLVVSTGNGSLAFETAVSIASDFGLSGRVAVNSLVSVAGTCMIDPTAMLTGIGTLNGNLILDGTLAPGSGPGTLGSDAQTWNSGARYDCDISDAASNAGTGWDLLEVSAGINVQATADNPFTTMLTSTGLVNFNPDNNYTWNIASTVDGIINFASDKVVVDDTGFTNNLQGGTFALGISNGDTALDVVFTPNHAPTASNATYNRTTRQPVRISIASLLASNTSDIDGDGRRLVSVTSTNGATVTTNDSYIFYMPPANDLGESLTYTVRDDRAYREGDTVRTAQALIQINLAPTYSSGHLTLNAATNGIAVHFVGVPNYQYIVQRSTDLNNWSDLSTNTASAANGLFEYVDTNPPQPTAYYRTRTP